MSFRVTYEVGFLDLAAGFMKDDPAGVAELFDTLDRLADEPTRLIHFPTDPVVSDGSGPGGIA